jgi:hypothetical protein
MQDLDAIMVSLNFQLQLLDTMHAFTHEAVQRDTMYLELDLLFQFMNIQDCPVYFADGINHFIPVVYDEGFRIHSGSRCSHDCTLAIAHNMCDAMEVRGSLHI